MKVCSNPVCRHANAPENKFCIKCGKPLEDARAVGEETDVTAPEPEVRAPVEDKTILAPAPRPGLPGTGETPSSSPTLFVAPGRTIVGPVRRKFDVSALFGAKTRLVIG